MKTFLAFLFLVLCLTGCNHQGGLEPLRDHLANFGYAMFEMPRDINGAGTIVRVDQNGVEHIVAAPDQLIPKSLIIEGNAHISSYQGSVSVETKIAANFIKAPFSAEVITKNASSSKMVIGPLKNYVITELALLQWFQAHPEAYELVSGKCVITDVIMATSMDYQLLDANGSAIKLRPDLPKIFADAGLENQWEVKDEYTLRFNGPMYIGYKIIRINKLVNNFNGNEFTIEKENALQYKGLEP